MGIRLEITTDVAVTMQGGPSQRAQIDDALSALGFMRETSAAEFMQIAKAAGDVLMQELDEQQAAELDEHDVRMAATAPELKAAEAEKPARKRRTKAEIEAEKNAEAPQITISPENRVDPETAAQDTADEAAESEATKAPELTHDDVRNALGAYVKKFGMDAAQIDGPALLKVVFGDAVKKVTDIPNDQASLAKAVDGAREMLTKNPYGRKEV